MELGFVRQATQLVENVSVVIFSENRYDEQAAALTLLAKCNVAAARTLDESCPQRTEQIQKAIAKLEVSKTLYQKLECVSKIKDVVYFQVPTVYFNFLYQLNLNVFYLHSYYNQGWWSVKNIKL